MNAGGFTFSLRRSEIILVLVALFWLSNSVQGIGELRLVNNNSNFSDTGGRLEINLNGEWGTICIVGFGFSDATLACNQLGYRSASRYGAGGTLGYPKASPSTPIWISNLLCDPSEHLTIYHCPRSTGRSCNHSQDVQLECSSPFLTRNFIVRLASRIGNSPGLTAGRIEVHFSGKWGTICSTGFDLSDAVAICDVLTGSKTVLAFGQVGSEQIRFEPGPNSYPVWLQNIHCWYNNDSASGYSCVHDGLGVTNCIHSQDVGISCLANGAVRLISGSTLVDKTDIGGQAGRLEVYYNGEWGTVCQDGFGQTEANIVCGQLGYRTALRYGTALNLGYRQGMDRIWLSNIGCSSRADSIIKCRHSTFGIVPGCFHFDDVAVECDNFQLRLVTKTERSSASLTAGRVEVLYNGQWGSICSKGFGSTDASVLCSVLTGSSTVLSYGTVGNASLPFNQGPSSSPVWIEGLSCSRSSNTCTHHGYGNTDCGHNKDIAISCQADGAVRLINSSSAFGPGSSSGRLEIYNNGQWGTVCSNGFDQTNADVVCRQLGYNEASRYGAVGELGYPAGSGALWLTDVRCSDKDLVLSNCTHSGFGNTFECSHLNDIAISCIVDAVPLSAGVVAGIVVGVTVAAMCAGVTCLGFVYVLLKAAKKKYFKIPSRTSPPAPQPSAPPPKPTFMKTVQTQQEVIILKKN